ncbi:MAG: hypothetical protein CVU18_10315 [Betaproteobacteria bacterium HGW-Betaproteobacteria-12]|nr:MAG: hypothetical protein CVU18_10315 [Betaproteobacteria bacterium HGW-Betaproteobacteria-12]
MRENEVPQENNCTLEGHRKAVYARGDDGRIRLVATTGWEVEEIVTRQAVEDLDRLTADARQRALAGQTSPLEYHMHRRRLDLTLLSQLTGLWQWRIRRHFRPDVFAGLGPSLLARYAEAMGIGVEELKKVD